MINAMRKRVTFMVLVYFEQQQHVFWIVFLHLYFSSLDFIYLGFIGRFCYYYFRINVKFILFYSEKLYLSVVFSK